ncbi:phage terminase small subunit [Bacillus gobiensis]|uniref:phage terminase small subunit n=1 Tax=Bacillus gobiensis TaxID=1441095 RepID=UPI003D1B59BE
MNWQQIREEYENSSITLKALAEKHDIKLGTLKSRKSREGWSRDATNQIRDATPKKRKEQKYRSGNPNPAHKFPKHNSFAKKHGMFSKYLPEDTLEIMESMNECSAADLIWDQIQIQYAAIIRAQQIMFVESKEDMTKELKKTKESDTSSEEEYEIQFAWDKHATFLNAQSRAMSELRSLIKQFNELAHEDDERRLKLEQMRLGIEKTKAEINKLNKSEGDEETQKDVAAALRGLVNGINSKAD